MPGTTTRRLILAVSILIALAAPAARAEALRLAFYATELGRKGPGLLYRDIARGDDPQAEAVAAMIAAAAADVLVLSGIDYDHDLLALSALADRVAAAGGGPYPHRFALPPNAGLATGLDIDGDGRTGGPGDAQGWGRFAGSGALAILSRLPVDGAGVRDFSGLPWADLPGNLIDGAGLSVAAAQVQRLSSHGHWLVPLHLPGGGRIALMTWQATPPVFDGPEDRNGRRNHDEAALWLRLLDGDLGAAPEPPFVILGNANLDPLDGEGRTAALRALLSDPRLQDPAPGSAGGAAAAVAQGGANAAHRGDPALDTVDWGDDPGPGNLRVTYLLPSADLAVGGAGVLWAAPGDPMAGVAATASRHRLVWIDLALP